ncbi:MAG: hypothetical protein HOV87_03570 [Catenulispora sp.]|nr:hypothetical protein [Catenulispora sp.]
MPALAADTEQDAIDSVTARLAATFEDVPRDQVEALVQRALRRFDDSRVRTFVPVLVEHAARDELAGR